MWLLGSIIAAAVALSSAQHYYGPNTIVADPPSPPPTPEINFDCPSANGYFAHPHLLCSAVHFECINNEATVKICEEEAIFEPASGLCKQASEVAGCNFDCTNKEDAAYSEGCSQFYWWCWQGKATKHACPTDLRFNADNGQCNEEASVYECTGVHVEPSTPAPQEPPVTVDFDCTDKEGAQAFSHYDCLDYFVLCSNNLAVREECPSGLHFNPDKLVCGFASQITQCGGTEPALAPPPPPEPLDFECPSATGYFAHPHLLCSAVHIECINNEATIKNCAETEVFEASSGLCKERSQVEGCSFDCSSRDDGTYSEGCSEQYWWCWQSVATKHACPSGLRFNAENGQCNEEASVYECTGVHVEPSTPAPQEPPVTLDFDCTGLEGAQAFDAQKCLDYFVMCTNGLAVREDCPSDLHFNPEEAVCGFKSEIAVCGGVAQAPAPKRSRQGYYHPTTEAPTTEAPAAEEPRRGYASRPHPQPVPAQAPAPRRSYYRPTTTTTTEAPAAEEPSTYAPRRSYYHPTTTTTTTTEAPAAEEPSTYAPRRSYYHPTTTTTTTEAPAAEEPSTYAPRRSYYHPTTTTTTEAPAAEEPSTYAPRRYRPTTTTTTTEAPAAEEPSTYAPRRHYGYRPRPVPAQEPAPRRSYYRPTTTTTTTTEAPAAEEPSTYAPRRYYRPTTTTTTEAPAAEEPSTRAPRTYRPRVVARLPVPRRSRGYGSRRSYYRYRPRSFRG